MNPTRAGCHDPMQATLRRPRWVLRGRRETPQRVTTPSVPLPLVIPMVSMFSFSSKTASTGTGFSKKPKAKSTFSAVVPPLIWISMQWAFFWPMGILRICVWQMARTTVACFLSCSSSAWISFFPSLYFLAYFVKAFFLALYQFL